MYCIPKNKFNMADMLAWLTGSVQHQQTEQGQQTLPCVLYTEEEIQYGGHAGLVDRKCAAPAD
jgi:hypothetical protein